MTMDEAREMRVVGCSGTSCCRASDADRPCQVFVDIIEDEGAKVLDTTSRPMHQT